MTQMAAWSDSVFKITMINMLMPLMKNVDNLQDHMGNFSREMKSAKH